MSPKVSVIVPVYNLEKYIARSLDSLLNQTYKNIEVIVVDDGSSDGSRKIIEEYSQKDDRIISIFKKNTGVSDTRNKGLEIASGDYVGFMDGDDTIEPNMYQLLVKNAIENNADISHCGYQLVKPSEVVYYHNTGEKLVQNKIEGLKELILSQKVEPATVNKLFKREIVEDVRMHSDIKYNEDYLYNIEAFDKAKITVFEDKPLYHYILRKGSAVTTKKINPKRYTDPLKINRMVTEKYKDSKELFPCAVSREINTNVIIYREMCDSSADYAADIKTQIKKTLIEYKEIIGDKSVISKKLRLQAKCIMYAPFVYKAAAKTIFKAASQKNNYKVD